MARTHWKRCLSCLYQYGQLALVVKECPCIRRNGAARGREARGRAHGARAAAHRACSRAGRHVPQRRPGAPRKWCVYLVHYEVHNTQNLEACICTGACGFAGLHMPLWQPGAPRMWREQSGDRLVALFCWYVVLPFAALAPCCSHVCLAPCLLQVVMGSPACAQIQHVWHTLMAGHIHPVFMWLSIGHVGHGQTEHKSGSWSPTTPSIHLVYIHLA